MKTQDLNETPNDLKMTPNDLLLSASPAGTLDSGHGSEQTLEYRDGSPSTRSPSNHSSPRHSPRRTVGSLPEEIDGARESNGARESIDENPWLNELGMIVKFLRKFCRIGRKSQSRIFAILQNHNFILQLNKKEVLNYLKMVVSR